MSFENSCPSDTAPHIVITVNNLPTFTWTSSDSDTTICAEDLVTFQASPVDSVNTYQYLINNTSASGYTFAGTHNTSSLSHNDTISLIAIDTVSCRDTLSMIFNVNPLPTTSLASSIVGNVICTGDAVTFTGTGADSYEFMVNGVLTTDAGTNYQWFLDGSIITGANSQTFTPTTSGNYSVQVTLTNGCVSSSNDYYFGMVSIAEFDAAELKIYPNPTKGLLTVNFQNFEKNGEVNLTVIDQAGRVVKSVTTLIQENIQLDLFDIESGSYQIVIQHQGFEKTVRFVKTNF